MLAVSSHDRNNHPESDYYAIATDVHTAFPHADNDQELFAEASEEPELREDEVWKLHKALHGYREAPKLWHQQGVTLMERVNSNSLRTDPSCAKNVELDISILIHVDDRLRFGPGIELQHFIEHDARCGASGTAGLSNALSRQSDRDNRSRKPSWNESEEHPRRLKNLATKVSKRHQRLSR